MNAITPAKRELRKAARTAGESRALEILARAGLGASALIQVLLGALAIQLGSNQVAEADQTGALQEIADVPGGFIVLWVGAIGLLSLALWLLLQAALVSRASTSKKWAVRLQFIVKAAAYGALGATALAFAQGHPSHATETTRRMSGGIFALPGGPLLLILVGAVALGVGGYFMAKGVRRTFTKDIVMPTATARLPILILGVVGYLAKGLVVAIAGIVFVLAAVQARPDSATGLAGAMESLRALPLGAPLLLLVGAGLIGSGAYNAARAWLAKF